MVSEAVPPICVPASDVDRLRQLALDALKDADPVGRFLLSELDRANVVASSQTPSDIVRIDHWVTFREDREGPAQSRVLTFPENCHNQAIHLSVASPIGAAVLGLRSGASMRYVDDNGVTRLAIVEDLSPPPGISFFRPANARPVVRKPDFDPSPDPDPGPSAA